MQGALSNIVYSLSKATNLDFWCFFQKNLLNRIHVEIIKIQALLQVDSWNGRKNIARWVGKFAHPNSNPASWRQISNWFFCQTSSMAQSFWYKNHVQLQNQENFFLKNPWSRTTYYLAKANPTLVLKFVMKIIYFTFKHK